ncbi:tyrosine-type recombinase/integrase [Frateuria aurantia]|uniref:Integrase n=1 Tax=Frateuria aurantia (strain ATCC 33424 / DSM 6220 / KCTC 2777 / LMG 1558 / NBRC 3245 / NCIMB 13370) TaxID=767434 RepID=H8L1W4_FRAAD|nr:integrase arm-type DNA-binding domain-containing protein [Frateuria aurantia]AFC86375.1 Integrase [Frateuria aurantia DSM 6220]
MPLTDTAARKAAPRDKSYRLPDGGGMYLEVMPNGSRYWRLKYRFGGKEKRLALGVYPGISLADARKRREDARRLLADGIDPGAARKEAKQEATAEAGGAVTFEQVARQWLARQDVAEVTANKNQWLLEEYLFPSIGQRPIADITPRELLAALRETEDKGLLETARRSKIKAGQVFRYAIIEGLCEADPMASLRGALKTTRNRHHAAITDPVQIGGLMRAMDGFAGTFTVRCALLLSALLFVRPGELRKAEWAEMDLDGAMWRIPGEKMKMGAPHLVPLSEQALAILRDLHGLTGHARYVFSGLRTDSRPMSENTVNTALRALGYDKATMTAHGFRSMAATRLNEMGWNADAIERQLAHAESNKVRDAYTSQAQYLPERQKMMQAWADYLDSLKAGGTVVAFKSKAG